MRCPPGVINQCHGLFCVCPLCLPDDSAAMPIIKVETNLDQRCSLEQGTKDEVINLAIQFFRYYGQFMEKQENMSVRASVFTPIRRNWFKVDASMKF
uniref:PAP-associated domain-containing protein n=1 Tax=Romanomermis culicivorax TaxID=13658 RepID=A0A915JHN4_ROMCU